MLIENKSIIANCHFGYRDKEPYSDRPMINKFMINKLSYEAALWLWDQVRWKTNRIEVNRIFEERPLIIFIGFVVYHAVMAVDVVEHPRLYGKPDWIQRGKFFIERSDFIDPYFFDHVNTNRVKDLLVAILDDVINRPEPLRVHDTKNFVWQGGYLTKVTL